MRVGGWFLAHVKFILSFNVKRSVIALDSSSVEYHHYAKKVCTVLRTATVQVNTIYSTFRQCWEGVAVDLLDRSVWW